MGAPFPYDEKACKTLFIDTWSSECGGCGREAFSHDTAHVTVAGYGGGQPGCGVKFEYVSSNYTQMKDHVSRMRPDLEWYSPHIPEEFQ